MEMEKTFENALQELDDLPNYKRPYLRDLIKEVIKG